MTAKTVSDLMANAINSAAVTLEIIDENQHPLFVEIAQAKEVTDFIRYMDRMAEISQQPRLVLKAMMSVVALAFAENIFQFSDQQTVDDGFENAVALFEDALAEHVYDEDK